jgi:hypothetical protein
MFLFSAALVVLATSLPASAVCIAPSISHDGGMVEAGDTLRVEGISWGDKCYDTGPPPEGEGYRGTPLSGIELLLVQGETDIVVAKGDADARYEFSVTITVPSELRPGQFHIRARTGTGSGSDHQSFSLAFVDTGVEVDTAIAAFDESDAVAVSLTTHADSVAAGSSVELDAVAQEAEVVDATDTRPLLVLGAVMLALLVAIGLLATRWSRQP